jgi:Alpha amylase, catalytic domain
VSGWPGQPVIYEINTAVWLTDLSESAGRRLTLADVPAAAWDDVTPVGVDAVWLMGVWQRSPAGLALAMANPELLASFRDALPDLTSSDVIGSPHCVRSYVVDAAFGGPDALAAARTALRDRGVSLLLDYVPNHVAPDHPWVRDSPELFVRATRTTFDRIPPAGFAREATYWLAVVGAWQFHLLAIPPSSALA